MTATEINRLEESGKIAVVRALVAQRAGDSVRHARYSREASGYADLLEMVSRPTFALTRQQFHWQ